MQKHFNSCLKKCVGQQFMCKVHWSSLSVEKCMIQVLLVIKQALKWTLICYFTQLFFFGFVFVLVISRKIKCKILDREKLIYRNDNLVFVLKTTLWICKGNYLHVCKWVGGKICFIFLSYLHSCDPPIIHGNLACDTIFIQHNGLIKIGSGKS